MTSAATLPSGGPIALLPPVWGSNGVLGMLLLLVIALGMTAYGVDEQRGDASRALLETVRAASILAFIIQRLLTACEPAPERRRPARPR